MYDKQTRDVFVCKCEKCGYGWTSYRETLPTHCANKQCSNPTKWNVKDASRPYTAKTRGYVMPTESVSSDFDFGA